MGHHFLFQMLEQIKKSKWGLTFHFENEIKNDLIFIKNAPKILDAFVNYLNLKNQYQIHLIFLSKTEMEKINQKYYPFKKVSDILSFPVSKYRIQNQDIELLGEIYFCLDVIEKQAEQKKISFYEETKKLFIHSLLHFCGYEHKDHLSDQLMAELIENIANSIK